MKESSELTLYAYPFRSRAERVLWAIQELGLNCNVIRIKPFVGDGPNPELLKINPDGKVPVLIHGEKALTESLAIIEYLNSISGNAKLVPVTQDSIYDFRNKMHYGLTEIEPYLWFSEQAGGPLKRFYNWPQDIYPESINRVLRASKSVSAFIVDNAYLSEVGFTMLDIYYYHILTWAKQHGIEHSADIEEYLNRLEKRETFPKEMYWK